MTYQYCKNHTVTYKYLQVHIMIAKQDKSCEQALVYIVRTCYLHVQVCVHIGFPDISHTYLPIYLLVVVVIKIKAKEKFYFYFQGRNSGLAEGRPTHNAVQTPVGFSHVRSCVSDIRRQYPSPKTFSLCTCNGQCWEVVTMSTVLARQVACCTRCSVGQNDDADTAVLIVREEGHHYCL